MRGADILARTLESEGTDTVFALSGNQIMPIFDACLETSIRLVHTRHEASAGFMAEGYAQISGKVGVALVTAGAGLGNAISPLLTARASQTPLLLLSGDSPAGQDGRGTFQEMDQVALTSSATKLSRRVTDADAIADEIRLAMEVAKAGQPGPVHLSLPVDMLNAEADRVPGQASFAAPESLDLGEIAAALRSAERPLVLLGPELNPTRARLDLSALGVPAIPMESPRGANDPSLGRFGKAWAEADLVVVLGKPVDFSLRFGTEDAWPHAKWITVHGDPAEVERARRNLGDRLRAAYLQPPRLVAESLTHVADRFDVPVDWSRKVAGLCAERPPAPPASGRIDSASLCRSVQGLVDVANDPILVSDGGEIGQWAQALVTAPRRIVNGVSGAIGGGIGYAIGAKAAAPEHDVIALMGDGTVGFHLAEFETAFRENLPFLAVIGNDMRWNAEHELQRRNFGESRMHGCLLSGARYDEAAAALGAFGAHVTHPDDLPDALAEALRSGRPACVNVEIEGLPAPVLS